MKPKDLPICTPPQVPLCIRMMDGPTAIFECTCAVPPIQPAPKVCTMTLVYPQNNPSGVYLNALEHGCDQAGLELALAVALARLLSGAPLP